MTEKEFQRVVATEPIGIVEKIMNAIKEQEIADARKKSPEAGRQMEEMLANHYGVFDVEKLKQDSEKTIVLKNKSWMNTFTYDGLSTKEVELAFPGGMRSYGMQQKSDGTENGKKEGYKMDYYPDPTTNQITLAQAKAADLKVAKVSYELKDPKKRPNTFEDYYEQVWKGFVKFPKDKASDTKDFTQTPHLSFSVQIDREKKKVFPNGEPRPLVLIEEINEQGLNVVYDGNADNNIQQNMEEVFKEVDPGRYQLTPFAVFPSTWGSSMGEGSTLRLTRIWRKPLRRINISKAARGLDLRKVLGGTDDGEIPTVGSKRSRRDEDDDEVAEEEIVKAVKTSSDDAKLDELLKAEEQPPATIPTPVINKPVVVKSTPKPGLVPKPTVNAAAAKK